MNSGNAVPQSDLYSLGIVLYEMLTNRVPFDDQTAMTVALRHLNDPPPPPRDLRPEINVETQAIILRLLDKEPEQRYENGETLIAALEQALGVTDQDDVTREIILPGAVLASKDDGPLYTEPNTYTRPDLSTAETIEGESTVIPPPVTPRRRRMGLYALAVVILGALSLLVILAISSPAADNGVAAAATATLEATAVAVVEDSTAPAVIEDLPTQMPTATPTATLVPVSPVPLVRSDEAQVELIYDSQTLILRNRSDTEVDLSGISFVQPVDDGPDLVFQVRRWDAGSAPTSALPPGDCLQVWTTHDAFFEVPEICGLRHKWDQASFTHWFWISETPGKSFELRRGGQVLAVCPVDDRYCLVDLRREAGG